MFRVTNAVIFIKKNKISLPLSSKIKCKKKITLSDISKSKNCKNIITIYKDFLQHLNHA